MNTLQLAPIAKQNMTRCFNNKTKCTRVYHLTPDSKIECSECFRQRTSSAAYRKTGKKETFKRFIPYQDRFSIYEIPSSAEPYHPRRGSSRSDLALITNTLRSLEIGEGFMITRQNIPVVRSANSRIKIGIQFVINPTDNQIYAKRTS